MKAKVSVWKRLPLVAGALLVCALNLTAQTGPSIITQPASQTNLAGTAATFTVSVSGSGPFTYQWQLNGTNLPNTCQWQFNGANNIITTVAGGGTNGLGDGAAATNASLHFPCGVAFDATGNLYIADAYNERVRMVGTNGIITTVAGNGSPAYAGDGGAATNASLFWPWDLALDSTGNLYIADEENYRIRKVGTNGIINSVASAGEPYGVAVDAAGDVYISASSPSRILKVDTNSNITTVAGGGSSLGDGGAATNASLNYPSQITFDAAGNLYIADSYHNRIRKVGTNGIISTVAGNGNPSFSGDGGPATKACLNYPTGVALDAFGNLYIADFDNNRIRKVDANGVITTFAGTNSRVYSGDGGPASNAGIGGPQRLALDASGNLYCDDGQNNRIREVHFAGYPILVLSNVVASNAGSYSVVVTNSYGSVTSAVAALTVTIPSTPPQIVTADGYCGFLTNQFGFNLGGAFGQTIVVDGSTDLVNWTPLLTNTIASGNGFYFCDPCWTNFGLRFYRARLP